MSYDIIREYRKQIPYGEAVLRVYADFNPMNPRTDYDHNCIMACKHRRYELGDEQIGDRGEFLEYLKSDEVLCYLPLYLYDHSGLTMSTSSFSCRWDSGQVGYIYTTKEHLESMGLGTDKYPIPDTDKLYEWMREEVAEFDRYLCGEVYGFTYHEEIRINPNGDINETNDDSCWGFSYSDWDDMILGMLEHVGYSSMDGWIFQ